MSNMTRRTFVQSAAVCGLVGGGLLSKTVLAEWPSAVFAKEETGNVVSELFGSTSIEESAAIELIAPEIAENGSVVPITVRTSLPNVESVSIVVDKNPKPLAAHFVLPSGGNGNVSTRIKIAKRSDVTVIAKSNGKLYSAKKYIKVTIGGCGGGGNTNGENSK